MSATYSRGVGHSVVTVSGDKVKVNCAGKESSFSLDGCFGPEDSNRKLYDEKVNSMLKGALGGYNVSILAFGATGGGKSHVMTGTEADPGVIPLLTQNLFRHVGEKNSREFMITVSHVEIMDDKMTDLLNPHSNNMTIRQHPFKGIFVDGLSEFVVRTGEEIAQYYDQGNRARKLGATDIKAHRARAAAIFTILVEQKERQSSKVVFSAKITLADLAGCEGNNSDQGNQVLLKVISTLGEGKNKGSHIPYRDSKLSRLLQESLGGNSATLMIAAMSPLAYIEALHHVEEMETCSSIRCKDPQPFVQYRHDALNKNKMFFPQCTILHRCMNFTGCCGDMRRECVPKKTSVIRKAFLVVDMSTISHDIMTFDPTNARMIELVNHTQCECREKPRQRRCPKQCPVPLQLVQEGHDCSCDCQPVAGGEACENVKHGVVPLSIDGLVCIKEDNCYKPQCSVDSFDVKTGFCPLSDIYALPRHMFRHEEERRNCRNLLKGMGVEYAEIFIKVSAGNKGTPQPNTHRQGKDKQKRTNKESPSRPDKKPRSGSHKTTSSNKPAPHRRTKSKNKSKQSKSKNQNNSKRERKRFKHGGTFSAQDFLQGMVPSHPLSHSGPNSRTVHGAAYNFKKKNVRTKPTRSTVDTEHPTPPQSLSMPRVPHASTRTRNPSYIETVKDTLTASPKVKATDIASTVSNSTAISNVPSPSSPHVTTSKLPSSSVRAKSPISRPSSSKTDKHNMGEKLEPITSSQNRTVLVQTQTTSTAQPPQISSSVPTPTLHTNTSILQKTNQRSSLSSSSTQEMFTNVLSSSFATTTSPSISTSSNSDRKDAANTREKFEIFNNKVDNPGGDRAAISSENDKDSLGEVTEIDNSVEDEGAPVERSGSDAET